MIIIVEEHKSYNEVLKDKTGVVIEYKSKKEASKYIETHKASKWSFYRIAKI